MIAKRCQYRAGGPRNRLTSSVHIKALLEYLVDSRHPNHIGVSVRNLRFWNSTQETFIGRIEASAERYRAKPKGRGKPWKGEIAEHIVFAPPPNAGLSDAEREVIETNIVGSLCSQSAVTLIWHLGADGRDELHVVASNFTDEAVPGLRVTSLRQAGGDYKEILREVGEHAIHHVNQLRTFSRRANVPTVAEIRAEKRKASGRQTVAQIVFDAVGPTRGNDRDEVASILRGLGWTVRTSQKNISVTPPGKKKPYRWEWEVLFTHMHELHESWLKEHGDLVSHKVQLSAKASTTLRNDKPF